MNKSELIEKLENTKIQLLDSIKNPSSMLTEHINKVQVEFLDAFINDLKQLNEEPVKRDELLRFCSWMSENEEWIQDNTTEIIIDTYLTKS